VSGDERVIYAREFLAGARKRKVTELPPSVLVRELAEARRVLGQVLDYLAEGAGGPEQRAVLAQALADAIAHREPPGDCPDCRLTDALWCRAHEDGMEAIGAYRQLGLTLGIEVPR